MIEFKLTQEFIPLMQLLKVTNVCGSGGEAGQLIMEGLVTCNGEPETRKRYKVRKGDIINLEGQQIKVV